MKILCVCPSIYPKKLNNMIKSLELTKSKYTDLIVCSEGTVTEAINKIFTENISYDYFFICNDDITFNTALWDLTLAKKGKITYGNDAIENGLDGQFLMIDGDFARAVGWLQLPTLNRYCGDVVWRYIAQQLNVLEYVPSVKITHHWDGADAELNNADMQRFAQWLPWSFKDISKIQEVLNGK